MRSGTNASTSCDRPVERLVSIDIVRALSPGALRMEPEFWDAFNELCDLEGLQPGQLIDVAKVGATTVCSAAQRASALRLFLVSYFRNAAGNDFKSTIASLDVNGDLEPGVQHSV